MAPSPFNTVKLELALLLVLILPVWLVAARVASDAGQIAILALYGNAAALWLWYRIRRVMGRVAQKNDDGCVDGEK